MKDEGCLVREKCQPNPCHNGGTCVQIEFAKFRCDCPKNYTGTLCHTCMFCRFFYYLFTYEI